MAIGRLTDTLQILWEASDAEDWINQENWIPFCPQRRLYTSSTSGRISGRRPVRL
jgi:hypothetical protein